MKKIMIFSLLVASLSFAACDPIEDREEMTGSITVDQIQATVTVEQIDGQNVNKVFFECKSPISCQWTNGVDTKAGASGEMFLLLSGENTITLKGLCADGSIVEKNFPINVDKIHYAIDPAYGLLFGSGEKVWKWAETDCLGNGGWRADQQGPEWWKLSPTDVEGQMATEVGNATMKFSLIGKKIEFSNGKSGVINFTTGDACFNGWYGTFTSTCGVLCGKAFNDCYISAGTMITKYQLVSLTEDRLVLGWCENETNAEWSGTGWWWVFEAQ